ncbi:MAG: tRNA (N6-threonylcarbamoyladenosine(37)-N6)-methyltransferase TrmO [Mesorhizobium sp.]|nr:tRNA (N6-threonylcarbamoyladenosine(37)-N6)-methyltransferase TrmO [Mesorhizobium sp.]
MTEQREGEIALPFDPGATGEAAIVFIGQVRSAWRERANCPKNMAAARETGQAASLHVDEPYRPGLIGLERASHAIVLTWLDRSARNLIMQKPRHANAPSGVFALRSPARPNPIGLHICRILSVDHEKGVVELDAVDVLDETPLVDIKPYFASTDSIPDAVRADREAQA